MAECERCELLHESKDDPDVGVCIACGKRWRWVPDPDGPVTVMEPAGGPVWRARREPA